MIKIWAVSGCFVDSSDREIQSEWNIAYYIKPEDAELHLTKLKGSTPNKYDIHNYHKPGNQYYITEQTLYSNFNDFLEDV